jgi:predicted DCC family thiol-disulfide oxidoreductase YuxK
VAPVSLETSRNSVQRQFACCIVPLPNRIVRACYAFASVRPAEPNTEILFYDGHCGLCHGAVKFVLKHDEEGIFRFAPLQGETFRTRVSTAQRASVPDSVVLLTGDGTLLARSDAFLHVFGRLGGRWRILAGVLGAIPRPVRDMVYDFVARVRYRIFGRREELCPIVPSELRARFDA